MLYVLQGAPPAFSQRSKLRSGTFREAIQSAFQMQENSLKTLALPSKCMHTLYSTLNFFMFILKIILHIILNNFDCPSTLA